MQNTRGYSAAVARCDRARLTEPQSIDRLVHRPSTVADHDFLLELFAESRPELSLLPDDVRSQVIRLQFDSQLSQYRIGAPDAVDWILELDCGGRIEPVGRCYAWQGTHEHRLMDLAIRRAWRRRGVASSVLSHLRDSAAQVGVPLRLSVWHTNHDALRLYRRHGFIPDDDGRGQADGTPEVAGYVRLRWSAELAR